MPGSDKNPEEKQSKAVCLSRGDGSAILGNVDFIPMISRLDGTGFQNPGDL